MKNQPVYCALIEIQPLEGCELDRIDVAGVSVRCYIPAANADCALDMLGESLREMHMALVKTEWCVDYDNIEWENPDNQTEDAYVAEARDLGTVIFDTFHSCGHDAPDVA